MELVVESEVNRLAGVIVHTPGHEVSLVNPEIKDELLFDDIIYEEDARAEHLDMLSIFKTAMPDTGQVLEITDLAKDCLADQEARRWFIRKLIAAMPEENLHTIQSELEELSSTDFLRFLLTGTLDRSTEFSLPPIPNLLFTRDLAAVVGRSIILGSAARQARTRDMLLMELVVRFHPLFIPMSGFILQTPGQLPIEGGDILVVSKDVVMIGMSERTSFSALMTIAEHLLSGQIRHIIAVDIPKKRSSMHLDTLFTFINHDECVVFPPAITTARDNVVHMQKQDGFVRSKVMPDLKSTLESVLERDLTFIPCGGEDRTNQFREQWTDGANMFALAPGVVVGYERNTHTFRALADHGYRVVDQYSFVSEYTATRFDPDTAGKLAIRFSGNELCRGRGGARCMTLPISRLDGEAANG